MISRAFMFVSSTIKETIINLVFSWNVKEKNIKHIVVLQNTSGGHVWGSLPSKICNFCNFHFSYLYVGASWWEKLHKQTKQNKQTKEQNQQTKQTKQTNKQTNKNKQTNEYVNK